MLFRTSHDRLEHYIQGSNGWMAISYSPVEANRWYNIAITYKANTEYTIYVDGELKAQGDNCGATSPTTADLIVGTRVHYDWDYFVGDIQHLAIWDDVRTPDEIKDDMSFNFIGSEEGLLGYWPLLYDYGVETPDITGKNTASFQKVVWYPAE